MKTYAAYYDNDIRMESSSGGVFSLIASKILTEQGVVYGVALTKDCYRAVFQRVTEEKELKALRGSKYMQAQMGDTFRQVRGDLEEGKKVLFTGTGCQINGLRNFLQKEYDNLYCVDVVCHGTPSPKLWKKYKDFQTVKYGEISKVDFRSKDKGWKDFGVKLNDNYLPMREDSYMQMFLRNYSLRPSCYECRAKNEKKSDITIADFWGIDNVAPELNDNKGISLVIVRSEKGGKFFAEIEEHLKYKEVIYEDAVKENSAEYISVGRPRERSAFFKDLEKMDFEKLEKKYLCESRKNFFVRATGKCIRGLKKAWHAIGNETGENSLTLLFRDKSECSGCTACYVSCPKSAITMVEDEEGFLYPKIDETLCVRCGMCRKVCKKM